MTRAKRTAVFVVFLSTFLAVGLEASARTERLRWLHSDPAGVDGFRVYYSTQSGAATGIYAWQIDVGIPSRDAEGAFVHDLVVDDAATIYVAVTAYAGNLESDFSNERVRTPSQEPDSGGSDDGGGTPPLAAAAIDHFVLWNAGTDTVIDGNFTSDEQIAVDVHGCTAIEVVGNAYLAASDSAGSIRFAFDGQEPSTCSQAGVSHENDAPYAWENDSGPGQFDCAPSLTEVGSHTLTVTPYDDDDCGGAAGAPVTLRFDVIDSSSSGGTSPPPAALGTPGRPTLVLD